MYMHVCARVLRLSVCLCLNLSLRLCMCVHVRVCVCVCVHVCVFVMNSVFRSSHGLRQGTGQRERGRERMVIGVDVDDYLKSHDRCVNIYLYIYTHIYIYV